MRFNPDGKFLFVKMERQDEGFAAVGLVNIEYPKIAYVDGTAASKCYDYGIIDSNRFVAVCADDMAIQDPQQAQRYYQLRLYNTSNLKILDTYSISS